MVTYVQYVLAFGSQELIENVAAPSGVHLTRLERAYVVPDAKASGFLVF